MFPVGVEFCDDVLVNFESACIEDKNKDVNYIFQKTLSLNAILYVICQRKLDSVSFDAE